MKAPIYNKKTMQNKESLESNTSKETQMKINTRNSTQFLFVVFNNINPTILALPEFSLS